MSALPPRRAPIVRGPAGAAGRSASVTRPGFCFSYFHSSSPPIIHGNLTCDSMFIQHNGLLKIASGTVPARGGRAAGSPARPAGFGAVRVGRPSRRGG